MLELHGQRRLMGFILLGPAGFRRAKEETLQKMDLKNGMQGGNPIANILVVIVGAIVIGVSIVLGFFAFLVLSAIILTAAVVIAIRTWWARRQMPNNPETGTATQGDFIEGEFHVVKKHKNS